jgi:hypothetical protein
MKDNKEDVLMRYQSTNEQNEKLSLTIYNDHFGLVKEERHIHSNEPCEEIQYLDVAKKIETDSIMISGIHVLELNYDFDLVSKAKLLEKYLDETIYIYDKKTKEKLPLRLLSVNDGIIGERIDTKEIIINPEGELVLPSLPTGLIAKPALLWKIPKVPLNQKINVSYLTKGISWDANYVLNLKDKEFELTGWVAINNQSGTTYENAELKLIAGEVNRIKEIAPLYDNNRIYNDEMVVYSSEPSFEEKSFADQHMYTLNRPVTIKDEQEKQINFLNIVGENYRRIYEVNQFSTKPVIKIEIDNNRENNLEIPLPKGIVKVYQADSDNLLEFIGEDEIPHTAKKQPLTLTLGKAFDIVCDSMETNRYEEENLEFVEYHYYLNNQKEETVTIKIDHSIHDRGWEMVETSHDYEKTTSKSVLFNVKVKPDEVAAVSFKYVIDRTIYIKNRD